MAPPSVRQRLLEILDEKGVDYRELHHEPTRTSMDSARVRGEVLSIGGKALFVKVGEQFRIFVLSASRRIDSQAIKAYFQVKKTRFATPEELMELTGLQPGAVPPFGRPLLSFDLYVDTSIAANDRIAFNAGSLTDSIFLSVEDYLKVARPNIFRFSR